MADRRIDAVEHELHPAGDCVGDCRRVAAIGHVHETRARHQGEQLAGHVRRRADAAGAEVKLARAGFRGRDQCPSYPTKARRNP